MKGLRLLAVLPCLVHCRPHPQDATASTITAASDPTPAAQDDQLVSAISSFVASASLQPFATPLVSTPITEWGALGDSFTAGIGSNGLKDYIGSSFECQRYLQSYPPKMNADARLPGIPTTRKLNFGACSGKTIIDIRDNQLRDNPPSGYAPFGKPQLAVMTIGGNDLGFTE